MIHLDELIRVPTGTQGIRPGVYRVVYVAQRERLAALFWMGEGKPEEALKFACHARKPMACDLLHIEELLQKNLVQRIAVESIATPPHRVLWAQESTKIAKRNKSILLDLTPDETQFSLLFSGSWSRHLEAVAAKHEVSKKTATLLLLRYYGLRRDIEAASLDGRWRKGKCSERKVTQKLGRKHKRVESGHRPEAIGRNASQDDRELIKVFYDTLDDQSASKASMYSHYEDLFSPTKCTEQADGTIELSKDESVPLLSARQFRYALTKVVGELKLLENAAGERRINLSNRVAIGSARDRVEYPGQCYIIDATVVDLYLVSAFDRRRIIGRPVLYIVIDSFSSLIVGFHLALEGPNFAQARIAMYRAVSDKARWLNWLGVPHIAHLLPQGCVPTFWFADRGELHSADSRALQVELTTSLSLAAAYRAEWKAIVERNFGVLNTTCIHWVPGAVRKREKERGAHDYRLDAVFTLKEFSRFIARKVAKLNLTRDMSRHISGSMVSKSVVANPISFWTWGIQHKHGSARYLTQEAAVRSMLPHATALITRFGLESEKRTYVGDWMKEHEQFKLAGHNVSVSPAKLVPSPDDPALAWCEMPHESAMLEVKFQNRHHVTQEFCSEDVKELETVCEFMGQDLKDDTKVTRIDLSRENRGEVRDAKDKTTAALAAAPVTKSARTKGISANRKAELKALESGAAEAAQIAPLHHEHEAQEVIPAPATAEASPGTGVDYFKLMSTQIAHWSQT